MGWGFRKSVNLGKGLRLNLAKSGIGYSFGRKGLRFGKSVAGKNFVNLGTGGFYYRKYFGNKNKLRDAEGSKDLNCLPYVLIIVCALLLIACIGVFVLVRLGVL
jgi:hypothetical protein